VAHGGHEGRLGAVGRDGLLGEDPRALDLEVGVLELDRRGLGAGDRLVLGEVGQIAEDVHGEDRHRAVDRGGRGVAPGVVELRQDRGEAVGGEQQDDADEADRAPEVAGAATGHLRGEEGHDRQQDPVGRGEGAGGRDGVDGAGEHAAGDPVAGGGGSAGAAQQPGTYEGEHEGAEVGGQRGDATEAPGGAEDDGDGEGAGEHDQPGGALDEEGAATAFMVQQQRRRQSALEQGDEPARPCWQALCHAGETA